MKTSAMVAVLGLAAVSWSASARADETAKPRRVITVETVKVTGHRQVPLVAVDIGRVTERLPLTALKQPLVDRIAAAVEKDPF